MAQSRSRGMVDLIGIGRSCRETRSFLSGRGRCYAAGMTMRLTFLLGLAVSLLGCATGSAPDDASRGDTIRLASWNLEHLAERNGTGCRPRTDADYATLRAHAERLDADVVAFQEVESAAAARRVFSPERWTVVVSDRAGSNRGGACREDPNQQILKQDVGFAIRKGIRFKRNADLKTLGLGNPDLRWGVDVTLSLPRPVRLLAIHLKSGCNAGRPPEDEDCPVLFRQAEVLEQWVDARARAGEEFAVLGDWNRRTGLAGDAFLAMVSDDDPPDGRLVMTDAGTQARCVERYRDFIDHIAVGARTVARIVRGSLAEYHYGGREDSHPSDHCPVSVELRAS